MNESAAEIIPPLTNPLDARTHFWRSLSVHLYRPNHSLSWYLVKGAGTLVRSLSK